MQQPLIFKPLLKVRVWGGRVLADRPGDVPAEPIGESWELSDHDADSTVCLTEAYAGKTLHELFTENKEELCGKAVDPSNPNVFPLMLKLIDPVQDLSVQVHPNDEYAGKQKAGELGKTEAWIVLETEAGGKIYRGLKPGVTKESFAKALEEGTVADCLNAFSVREGDVVYVPSGTIHALGAGVRIAEIQQNSDTTYRVFDWNRVGLDGKPRELHVEHAMAVSDFSADGITTVEGKILPTVAYVLERLVDSPKFRMERLKEFAGKPCNFTTGGERFHLITVAKGSCLIEAGGASVERGKWDSCLIPAAAGSYTVRPSKDAELLVFYIPDAQ